MEDEEYEMSEEDQKALQQLEEHWKEPKKERPVYKKGGHNRTNKK